ncbi:GntR family transcriptional regulator [Streptomyces sp. A7024]|uniref:GntR family transcriptional regulator n=1 Tax=Streptomyces coryli TaxID=1128680 RepID=A0A6G4U9C8_9ACTN|nr:GntR family transcriptional regulator [Streptomyces coryli]NGN67791.1 GntR family transcriptional regulator [Streptomyces coryli]
MAEQADLGAEALRVPRQRAGAGFGGGGSPARLRRSSVRAQTLDALRAMLASGELRAGEVYSAPTLGAGLGVSATPVREAMQQLAAEGVVEVVPNVGFRVVERRAPVREELAEVRRLLVLPVIRRLAAAEEPAPDCDRLRAAALAADAEPLGAAAERGFFAELFALAGNGELADVADTVLRRAQAARATARLGAGPGRASYAAVVDAMAAGDGDAAVAAAEELLR